MRLQDALDRFVVQLEADGRSEHTIAQYRRHIGLLARWLAREGHSDEVDSLTHETLALFLVSPDARGSRRGGQKHATSMNALRSSMRAFFAYAHGAGWSRENPARLIRRARCAGGPPRGLSDEDRTTLLGKLDAAEGPSAQRDAMLVRLLLESGIRLSSALALTDEDVDLARAELTLRAAKGQRVELIVLSLSLRDRLAGYLNRRSPGLLFPGKDGRHLSRRHAARRLEGCLRRAGCCGPANPHALRHTYAAKLYRQTGDVLLVQRALGHRSILSTMVYATADSTRLRAALQAH